MHKSKNLFCVLCAFLWAERIATLLYEFWSVSLVFTCACKHLFIMSDTAYFTEKVKISDFCSESEVQNVGHR